MIQRAEPAAVGILGGTFDPIHRGHLAVARQVLDQLSLDRVLLIPSSVPPHRRPTVALPRDRLAMVELATADQPGLEVSDVEVARGGVSYTVDTLRQLRKADPDRRLFLLLGADAALEMHGWRHADEIPALAEIVVFNRTGVEPIDAARLAKAGITGRSRVLMVDSPPISATELRQRLRDGLPTADALPAAVQDYIARHQLYGT